MADINVTGQAHVMFVRSPYANARINSIDAGAALATPGVIAVLTREHFPTVSLPPFLWDTPPPKLVAALKPDLRPCHPPLFPELALYAGQAVAAVVAENRYLAEDAAELVEIDYEPLDPVVTVDQALANGAPVLHAGWEDNVAVRFVVEKGDAHGALAQAAWTVSERFVIQRQAPVPLETRGAIASYDETSRSLTLWSGTQNAHPLRRAMSRMSGLELEHIRVIAPDVGGGFGGKGVLYPEDLIIGLTAIRLGRPIKWIEDRFEHMESAIHAREQTHDLELGVNDEGEIIAVRDSILVDAGAYNPLGLVIPYNTIAHVMGPYRVPNFEATARAIITTKAPTAPYRGAGRPEAVFAIERALDIAARRMGIDPVELRLRNLVTADEMPYEAGILYRDGEPLVLDGGDFPTMLRRASELVGWEEVEDEDHGGRLIGRGVAVYAEGTGIGPYEGAHIRATGDGRVVVHTGACSQGQGHETVFAQVCADSLGVPPGDIEVIGGTTDELEKGWGTVASRSAVVAGNAVAKAALELRAHALRIAGDLLGVAPSTLDLIDGRVVSAGAEELEFREVAAAAERQGRPFTATAYYEPPTVTWSGGAHAALVAVDPDSGAVEVVRYVAVHDCGREINPMIVAGQVRGGVAQGLGGALYEQVHYNDDGQLLTATLADYLIPTAEEIPPIILDNLETPSPLNPLGLRGVGEGGAIAPAAVIANAVEDALAGRAVLVLSTPLTLEKVHDLASGTRDQEEVQLVADLARH